MDSFHVKSQLTSIRLVKTRNYCESLFNNGNKENNFHRSDFENIWRTSLLNYSFILKVSIIKQLIE